MTKTKLPDFMGGLGKEIDKPNFDKLVNCQTCGHVMSRNAFTCPKCADPVALNEFTSSLTTIVIISTIASAVIVFIIILIIIFS